MSMAHSPNNHLSVSLCLTWQSSVSQLLRVAFPARNLEHSHEQDLQVEQHGAGAALQIIKVQLHLDQD